MSTKVFVSVPWADLQDLSAYCETRPDVHCELRISDYGRGRTARRILDIRSAFQAFRHSAGTPTLVVATSSLGVLVTVALRSITGRRQTVLAYDYLRGGANRGLHRWLLRRLDGAAVVRSSDLGFWTDTVGLDPAQVRLVKLPAVPVEGGEPQGYIYAGGSAQRDWAMLAAAVGQGGIPAVIRGGESEAWPPHVDVGPNASPADGRRLLASSSAVCVPFLSSSQSAGPIVLLDALSAGKPVVTTDTGCASDYISHGINGFVVSCGDAAGLRKALLLATDISTPNYAALARGARESVKDLTWEAALTALEELAGHVGGTRGPATLA